MHAFRASRKRFIVLMSISCLLGAAGLLLAWFEADIPAWNLALRAIGVMCAAVAIGVALWAWRTGRAF